MVKNDKKTGIYKYENKINKQVYIGQSVNIIKRYKDHLWQSDKDYPEQVIDRAIKKYGIENFEFEVICECPKEDLNIQEVYWIKYWDSYNNGYNCTIGGSNCFSGKDNPMYDNTIYTFQHKDGRTFTGTQYDLRCKYNLSPVSVSKVILGNRPSVKGWGFPNWFNELKKPNFTGLNNPKYDNTIYTFQHKDGRTFTGTQYDLRCKYNLHSSALSSVCSGRRKSTKGWMLR